MELIVKCTSDVKRRMRDLAKLYHTLLARNEVPLPEGVTSASEASITLMLDAFKTVPKFHFPLESRLSFPSHCWHLDLLELDAVQSLVHDPAALLEYISRRTATSDHIQFAFLHHVGAFEFSESEFLASVHATFRSLSREDIGAQIGSKLGDAASLLELSVNAGMSHHVTTFRNTLVEASLLYARGVCWLLLASDVCSAIDRKRIFSCAAAVLRDDRGNAHAQYFLARLPQGTFKTMLEEMLELLTVELYSEEDSGHLEGLCTTLAAMYRANYALHARDGLVHHSAFYTGFTEDFGEDDVRDDFVGLHQGNFAFSRYPFLVNARYKSMLLQLEAAVERDGALQHAIITHLFTNRGNEALEDYFLVLRIDRHQLVDSTLRELRRKSGHLKRPLRIQFVGEEGVDEGGLKKEFFQLLTRELLHPNYNMFYEVESSRLMWFVPEVQNPSNKPEFYLIGQIIGLAVYNNIILDLNFPMAAFRKLLRVPVAMDDLKELDPSLHHGLIELLQFQEVDGVTVEDVFCRSFIYEHEIFGEKVEIPLMAGGEGRILTSANRSEFVDAVCDYVLSKSIQTNYDAFRDGFLSVCTRGMLTCLRPEELEQLVCGNRSLDFKELEESTAYEGYDPSSCEVRRFWGVVHSLSDDLKRKFLRFCTGSDRIPVGGLKDLHFIVGKNGDDSDLLPTSHTCFNHLLLPAYSTDEKMRKKLLHAIENCEGFFGGK